MDADHGADALPPDHHHDNDDDDDHNTLVVAAAAMSDLVGMVVVKTVMVSRWWVRWWQGHKIIIRVLCQMMTQLGCFRSLFNRFYVTICFCFFPILSLCPSE